MLAILQLIVSLGMSILYSIEVGINFDFAGIFGFIIIFLVANIIMIIILLLLYVVLIYSTEKISPTAMWKRYMINHLNVYLFKFFYRTNLQVTGKENLPRNWNFVIYSNHIEYGDPMFIMQAYKDYPVGFIAKDPLFKYPILRNLMYGTGCIPITRFADRSALESIVKAIKQVKDGQPMGIFPEGKRTYSNDLIEFKPGAFKLAQKAKADISPVCLYNMHELSKKWRIWPTKVYLHVLPIIKYEDYKDMDSVELSKKVYDVVNEQMNKYKNS